MNEMLINEIKALIGKNVNIHLKDNSVIVNVKVEKITTKEDKGNRKFLEYSYKGKKELIELKRIAWLDEVFIP
jgi:hypothetical protein